MPPAWSPGPASGITRTPRATSGSSARWCAAGASRWPCYSDQHSIFYSTKKAPTLEEQLTGQRTPTQVGRLLEELGVRWIRARSPQAKGRVERLWGTFQDRLTSELRLAGAATPEQASVVLERYLSRHNRRFTVPPADPTPAWLPWPRGRALHDVFCFKYQRRVANDNTVRLGAVVMDIPPNRQRISYARCRADLHQRFDGTLHVFHNGIQLASASPPPFRLRDTRSQRPAPGGSLVDLPPVPTRRPADPLSGLPWKPPANHPWRR